MAQLATVLDPRFKSILLDKSLMEKKLLDYIKLKNKESIPTVQPRSSTVERTDDL